MVRLLAHLAGLPHHGSPSCFIPAPNPQVLLKSIDITIRWPTSLVGGERQGGSESRGPMPHPGCGIEPAS